jgi:hypothetical protein
VVVDPPHLLSRRFIMDFQVYLVLLSVEDDVVEGLGVQVDAVFPLGLLILDVFRFELDVGWLLRLEPEGEGVDARIEGVLILRLLGGRGSDRIF